MNEIEAFENLLAEGWVVASEILSKETQMELEIADPNTDRTSTRDCVQLFLIKDGKIADVKLFFFSTKPARHRIEPLAESSDEMVAIDYRFSIVYVPRYPQEERIDLKTIIDRLSNFYPRFSFNLESNDHNSFVVAWREEQAGPPFLKFNVDRFPPARASDFILFQLPISLSLIFRRGFFARELPHKPVFRFYPYIISSMGDWVQGANGISNDHLDFMETYVQAALKTPALRFLYQFYVENSHFGKIMIAASSLEELFLSRREESIFSKQDKKELVVALKTHFGRIPSNFEKLIDKLRDPRKFPKGSRTDVITENLSAIIDMDKEDIKRSVINLFDLRNRLAHNPRIQKFDGRKQLNFAEKVLIAIVENHVGRPYQLKRGYLFREDGAREGY